jgi:peptidoglycan/LPS O-acetylase OafA/YrhL
MTQPSPTSNPSSQAGAGSADTSPNPSPAFRISERIPELDGLRGLAIFLVILYHYIGDPPHGTSHSLLSRMGTILGQGATGVDLFFVLSGFLIGGILLSTRESTRYYRTFYLRRFHRIIPLYYGWILLFGLLWVGVRNWGGSSSADFRTVTPYWVYFLFLQNYFLGSTAVQAYWLVPTWSLAVEEQFYLLAPPLVKNLTRGGLVKLFAGVVVLSLAFRVYMSIAFGPQHGNWGLFAAYFWTPSRADDLALGVLTAIVWSSPQAKLWIQQNVKYFYASLCLFMAALLAILYWLVMPSSFVAATFGRSIYGLLFVSLLVVLLADPKSLLACVFRWRPLRELGKISYCVYIIHGAVIWTLFKFILHSEPRFDSWPAIGTSVAAFFVVIALAELSWHYFEHPLIRRGHKYSY